MKHAQAVHDLSALIPIDLLEHATLAVTEETGAFVGDAGAIVWQGGRTFVCFKPPSVRRNLLQELILAPTPHLVPVGYTPAPAGKTYYIDGGVVLCFVGTELCVLNTCSPDPATGSQARVVFWQTGIFMPLPTGSDTIDATARADIAALKLIVAGHETRLDKISVGAAG